MVSIIKKEVNNKEYYFLVYSYREEGKGKQIQKSLGKEIPEYEELALIKEEFNYEIFKKLWLSTIDQMKAKFLTQYNSLPQPIQVKDLRTFGVRFTHNTNRIEGSTLTLKDVALIIEDDISPSNKPVNDIIEAKAHMSVYEDMINYKEDINRDILLKWHKKIFELTEPNIAGIIRKYPIQISRSKHVPPIAGIEDLLDDLIQWYNENKNKLHPVYLACVVKFRFVSIHPYGDGNGRMCRILMNYILYKNQFPMFDIEYKIRQSYYNALENANIKEDDMIFIHWFFKNYIKTNKKYLT